MQILHVLPTRNLEYGGPISVAEAIAEETISQGQACNIYPPCNNNVDKRGVIALWRAINRADVIHIHGLWNINATLAGFIARRVGIPYVITPHGMLDRWALARSSLKKAAYGYLFERRNLKGAAVVHFLNGEECAEATNFDETLRNFILPNGVFADRFDCLPVKATLSKIYSELQDKVVVLFLGRLHPKKGFDLLLPAFANALVKCPHLHLLLAGPDQGGYKTALEAQVLALGLNSHVTFLGMVSGARKLETLASADFFVLPSHQEGDSVAVKEAMACRLPVLITPACHFPEVQEYGAGMVVQPDVQAWQQALISLYRNKDDRIQMGNKAWGMVRERYTWNNVVSKFISEYRRISASPQEFEGRDA
jgi:glycosyltransferase involved in cell wall biosynthesis